MRLNGRNIAMRAGFNYKLTRANRWASHFISIPRKVTFNLARRGSKYSGAENGQLFFPLGLIVAIKIVKQLVKKAPQAFV